MKFQHTMNYLSNVQWDSETNCQTYVNRPLHVNLSP